MSADLFRGPGDRITGPGLFACAVHAVDDRTGFVVVRLVGELDLATAPDLACALSAAAEASPDGLVVDLTDLQFIDSNGIHVLTSAARRACADGFPMILRNPTRQVLKVLRLTGADQLMLIGADDLSSGNTVPQRP